jgi:hypothetical protein
MKKFYMVLDTETVMIDKKQIAFDIGYSIINSRGFTEKSVNIIVADIFYYYKQSFIHDSYPGQNIQAKTKEYNAMIQNNLISVMTFRDFIDTFSADIKKYKIDAPAAYNCTFDCTALSNTAELLNITDNPFRVEITQDGKKTIKTYPFKDLYIPCKDLLKNNKQYIQWVTKYNFITDKGNIKFTAESVYSFLTKNPARVEKHLALSDVVEEAFIYHYLLTKKVKLDKKVTIK